MPTFEQPFKRVVRGTASEQEAAKQLLGHWYAETAPERLEGFERTPTPEERRLFQDLQNLIDRWARSYGGEPIPLSPDKLHVVEPDAVEAITDGKLRQAFFSILNHDVVVEHSDSPTEFAQNLAHELLHAKGYQAAQIIEGRPLKDVVPYRSGISVYDNTGEVEFFGDIEEAVVAELTHQLYQKELRTHSLCREEIQLTDAIKQWIERYTRNVFAAEPDRLRELLEQLTDVYLVPEAAQVIQLLQRDLPDEEKMRRLMARFGHDLAGFSEREGWEVREKMYKLLDEIVAKSRGRFSAREDVFQEFARAHFSGKLLPLARMIENILGKGRFRELASEFQGPHPR